MVKLSMDEVNFPLGKLKGQIEWNKRVAEKEKVNPLYWPIHDSGKEHYWETFRGFFPDCGNLDQAVAQVRKETGSMVVLDLASTGRVLEELQIDQGLAVSLGSLRSSSSDKVQSLQGDLLRSQTWREVNQWLERNNKKFFDIVFFRPGEAVLSKEMGVNYLMLKKAWKLLNPQGGIILVQFPKELEGKMAESVEYLKSVGIKTSGLPKEDNLWEFATMMVKKRAD